MLFSARPDVHKRNAAAGDNTLLNCSAVAWGVLDAMLDLLELGLGSGTNLDNGDAAGELIERSWKASRGRTQIMIAKNSSRLP